MSPLERRTLTLAIAGLGLIVLGHPRVRRLLTPSSRRLARLDTPKVQLLPKSIRERYVYDQ